MTRETNSDYHLRHRAAIPCLGAHATKPPRRPASAADPVTVDNSFAPSPTSSRALAKQEGWQTPAPERTGIDCAPDCHPA